MVLYRRLLGAMAALLGIALAARADTDFDRLLFTFAPPPGSVQQATLTLRLGGFSGLVDLGGFQVNAFALQGSGGQLLDLTPLLFPGGLLDQGTVGTQPVTVALPNVGGGLDWLALGAVGIRASLTDIDDGLFGLDYLFLEVTTSGGQASSLLGDRDWFGLGSEPGVNADLPGLPADILPLRSDGSLFDGAVSNITIDTIPSPVPEPACLTLFGTGALGLLRYRPRRRRAVPRSGFPEESKT